MMVYVTILTEADDGRTVICKYDTERSHSLNTTHVTVSIQNLGVDRTHAESSEERKQREIFYSTQHRKTVEPKRLEVFICTVACPCTGLERCGFHFFIFSRGNSS